jgi:hypothetical protein
MQWFFCQHFPGLRLCAVGHWLPFVVDPDLRWAAAGSSAGDGEHVRNLSVSPVILIAHVSLWCERRLVE